MPRPPVCPRDLTYRTSGERLFVWGVRATIVRHEASADSAVKDPAINDVFGQFAVADAAVALGRIFDLFNRHAHTSLRVHRTGCRCLSGDEASLVEVLAAAQAGDMGSLRTGLLHWLPIDVLDWTQMPFVGLARIFAGAGLLVPRRGVSPASHVWAGPGPRPTLH